MEDLDFFISYSLDLKFIRLFNNIIQPSIIHITAGIDRQEHSTDHDIELGMAKIKYWFDHIVSKSIAFSQSNSSAMEMFLDDNNSNRTGNLFLMVPEEPTDELLAATFQAKMNALSKGKFIVNTLNIESDHVQGLSFTLGGNHAILLPQTMDDWLGGRSYFTVPWWLRDDSSTIDVYVNDDTDISILPPWAQSLDFLDKHRRQLTTDANVSIVRPEFNPTVIKGGKNDKDRD